MERTCTARVKKRWNVMGSALLLRPGLSVQRVLRHIFQEEGRQHDEGGEDQCYQKAVLYSNSERHSERIEDLLKQRGGLLADQARDGIALRSGGQMLRGKLHGILLRGMDDRGTIIGVDQHLRIGRVLKARRGEPLRRARSVASELLTTVPTTATPITEPSACK